MKSLQAPPPSLRASLRSSQALIPEQHQEAWPGSLDGPTLQALLKTPLSLQSPPLTSATCQPTSSSMTRQALAWPCLGKTMVRCSCSSIASEFAQSRPTLCDSMDCSPPGSSVHDFPGKNIGVGCHFFLQGIFLTQGSNQVSHIAGRLYTI